LIKLKKGNSDVRVACGDTTSATAELTVASVAVVGLESTPETSRCGDACGDPSLAGSLLEVNVNVSAVVETEAVAVMFSKPGSS